MGEHRGEAAMRFGRAARQGSLSGQRRARQSGAAVKTAASVMYHNTTSMYCECTVFGHVLCIGLDQARMVRASHRQCGHVRAVTPDATIQATQGWEQSAGSADVNNWASRPSPAVARHRLRTSYIRLHISSLNLSSAATPPHLLAKMSNTTNPYDCATYPTTGAATSAPPAYWPPARNATSDDERACVAFPNYYMVQCCGTASKATNANGGSAAIHDPKCGWEVCISTTTDDEWEACFKTMDAQRGNVADKGYSFNCASPKKEKKEEEKEKSGARRMVVGMGVVAAACAALVLV